MNQSEREASKKVPPSVVTQDPDFQVFLEDCANDIERWLSAQAQYPSDMEVTVGNAESYTVLLDVGGLPPPPDDTASIADVEVRCVMGARLTGLSDFVQVDGDDWIAARFDQPGHVQWDWTVEGEKIGDGELRLELRPGVAKVNGDWTVPSGQDLDSPITRYHTDVSVSGSVWQRVWAWLNVNKEAIFGFMGLLGLAFIAAIRWGTDVLEAVRRFIEARKGLRETEHRVDREASACPDRGTQDVALTESMEATGSLPSAPSHLFKRPPSTPSAADPTSTELSGKRDETGQTT